MSTRKPYKILILIGTRPEAIKLAPVVRELETDPEWFQTINVASSQHTNLLHPFLKLFEVRVDHDLKVMADDQSPVQVGARILSGLDTFIGKNKPDCVLVQGDTITAFAGALVAFHHHIPVGHVEAGLRSGNIQSPFPEEMNRRLITQIATYHFASTKHNRQTLLSEGIRDESIFVTGNPVVDSLNWAKDRFEPQAGLKLLLDSLSGNRIVVLTTHRRESFGEKMAENLRVLRDFVDGNEDIVLVFPVHLNPEVRAKAEEIMSGHQRIRLIEPMLYLDFIHLLARSWLIVSDSGGVQEEAPTLGKPLLVIRENTERPEAIDVGVARLAKSPRQLKEMLTEITCDGSWIEHVRSTPNPFGDGDAAKRIADCLRQVLERKELLAVKQQTQQIKGDATS